MRNVEANDPLWQRMVLYGLTFVGMVFVWHAMNNDVWFMLNGGRYVAEHGFPYTDPFSVHENLAYVMQQWLSAVVFWEIYAHFGQGGLFVFESIMAFAILALYFVLCRRVAGNVPSIYVATGAVGFLLAYGTFAVRPQLFTYVILLTCVLWLVKDGPLWGYAVFSLLLVNFHAAMWGMLFVMLLPFAAAACPFLPKTDFFAPQKTPSLKRLAAAALIIAAAGFINPYGTGAMLYGFLSYGDPVLHKEVAEMEHMTITDDMGAAFFGVAAAAVFVAGRSKIPLQYVLFSLGTAYMTLSAWRNMSLFWLFGTIALVYAAKDWRPKALGTAAGRRRAAAFGAVLVLLLLPVAANDTRRTLDDSGVRGAKAVEYLLKDTAPENIRMFVNFVGAGSYMEFNGIKCYIDTRYEMYLKANNKQANILYESSDLQRGFIDYRDFFAAYRFTHAYVCEITPGLFRQIAEDPHFILLMEDSSVIDGTTWRCRLYKVSL